MATITEWLASLGMSEYAQRFTENGIDISVLRYLTDQDLEKIGVLLGHRRKMLAAIAEMTGAHATPHISRPARLGQAERTVPNAVSSRLCSAISWVQPPCRLGLIPKTSARSSATIIAVAPNWSSVMADL